jgi:trans-aconitate methyltransferase
VLPFLIQKCRQYNVHNILSLGAGPCVIENFLKQMLPDPNRIVVVDFDSFFISMAKKHFPAIDAEIFDFKTDTIKKLQNNAGISFDLAVFFNASYVLDDQEFVHLFKQLKEAGIPHIIDFQTSYIPYRDFPREYAATIKDWIQTRIMSIPYESLAANKGKFHGFSRSRNSLRRLYKISGMRIVQELDIYPYSYIAVLTSV